MENKLSIVHDNIQNFTNKQDILETELSCFDVICLTETWLDRSTENVDIELNGYIAYRRDRVGDSHGGVFVYVSKNFVSKQKDTLELPDIECVWIELSLRNKKLLTGTFYRPPNISPAVLSSVENSIGLALDTNACNIFITRDFNLDISANRSARKIDDIYLQYNLNQLITDPIHSTETSNPIIDLFLLQIKMMYFYLKLVNLS